MGDAADSLTPPYSERSIVEWFGHHYPLLKSSGIRANIQGLTVNDPNRHWRQTASKPPLFFRTASGLQRYDPAVHDSQLDDEMTNEDAPELGEEPTPEEATQFALESQLESFLSTNW